MSDETKARWQRSFPGWVLVALVVVIVLARPDVSETLVGTLLGFAAVFIGAPLLPGKKP